MATVQLFFFFSLFQYLKNTLESFNLVGSHSVHVWGEYMYPFTDEFTGTSIIFLKIDIYSRKICSYIVTGLRYFEEKKSIKKYMCHKIEWFHSSHY